MKTPKEINDFFKTENGKAFSNFLVGQIVDIESRKTPEDKKETEYSCLFDSIKTFPDIDGFNLGENFLQMMEYMEEQSSEIIVKEMNKKFQKGISRLKKLNI